MKKLIMWNVITLDGYFEGAKPWDLDFHNLAWCDELKHFIDEQLDSAEAIIYGKSTYIGMAEYWGKEKGKVADRLNQIKKYVCSSTLEKAEWNNTEILRDAVADISKLKAEGTGNLFIFGSGILSAELMKAGLFDEYRLCISPVFLGKGKLLFNAGLPYQALSLLEDRKLSSGGVLLRYASKVSA